MNRQRLGAGTGLVAAVVIACGQAKGGGSAEHSGGNAGHATGGAAAAAGAASGGHTQTSGGRSPIGGEGGSSGGERVAGAGGFGEAGAPSECAAIKCTALCKENWAGLNGCPTCACAPPAATLSLDKTTCPSASITLTAASSYSIARIDRWLIDFDWACSDQSLLGEPSRGHLQVGIYQPLDVPIDGQNRTFFFPRTEAGEPEYVADTGTIWLLGSGVPEIELSLQASSSFLSIRLENGVLVGGVEYKGLDSTGAFVATMAGPFSVAVPTPN